MFVGPSAGPAIIRDLQKLNFHYSLHKILLLDAKYVEPEKSILFPYTPVTSVSITVLFHPLLQARLVFWLKFFVHSSNNPLVLHVVSI